MRVDIKIEGIELIQDMTLLRYTDRDIYDKALGRTVRRMGTLFRATTSKEVRREYTTPAKILKSAIKTQFKFTKTYGYQYRFYVRGRTMNLIHFGARALKRGGVSVGAIKRGSGRIKLRHAFIARGGRVFSREGESRFKPINTLSVPQMFNDRVIKMGISAVDNKWEKELLHNIEYFASKA